jgi:hypothetical protein
MRNALVKRRVAMGITLAITVWLAALADDSDDEIGIQLAHSRQNIADPVKITGASAAGSLDSTSALPPATSELDWSALAGRTLSADGETAHSADLFKSHDWYIASKAHEPAAPPPPPVAPHPPFSYLGKLENTPKGTTFFLSADNKVYAVIAGQNLNDAWRLDAETDTSLSLTYLPLGQSRTLAKSGTAVPGAEDGNQGAY